LETEGLTLIGVALGVLFAAGLGLYAFLISTATPLHPNPQDVPSVTHAAPLPTWADAVERGRQLARAGLVDQNLPGLSVAHVVRGHEVDCVEHRAGLRNGFRYFGGAQA
jgi:hypothetical protein